MATHRSTAEAGEAPKDLASLEIHNFQPRRPNVNRDNLDRRRARLARDLSRPTRPLGHVHPLARALLGPLNGPSDQISLNRAW